MITKEERAEGPTEIISEADNYTELSSHYMTPEQVNQVCYPPRGTRHSIYSTAHALVSERHDKGDIVRMVYALLVKQSEYLESAEARAEAAERKNTMPCPYCDFASGQRGMDRCAHCDGTGSVSVLPWLKADRDEWRARAEAAERERDAVIYAVEHCPDGVICPVSYQHIGQDICYKCWLEWARQQARGGGKCLKN